MATFWNALSLALRAIQVLVLLFLAIPLLMLLALYGWVLIGDYTGWYRAENYITMSDH